MNHGVSFLTAFKGWRCVTHSATRGRQHLSSLTTGSRLVSTAGGLGLVSFSSPRRRGVSQADQVLQLRLIAASRRWCSHQGDECEPVAWRIWWWSWPMILTHHASKQSSDFLTLRRRNYGSRVSPVQCQYFYFLPGSSAVLFLPPYQSWFSGSPLLTAAWD